MRWFTGFIIILFLSFTIRVYAESGFISPVPENPYMSNPITSDIPSLPTLTFDALLSARLNVLGATDEQIPTSSAAAQIATASTSITPTPTALPRKTKKSTMTISLVGDSMTDTLGPEAGGLGNKLRATYPATQFTIINHGVGAENIDSGLKRLTNSYSYLGKDRPSVVSQKPDVIIVESFGYNPYSIPDGALTRHWLQLASVIDVIKLHLPETKIMLAATIAPNWNVFGDGAPFINYSAEEKKAKVETIKSYIINAIKFAQSQKLPLADAFHPTLDGTGNGKVGYINGGDHIHYSDSGRSFMATIMANAIVANKLLE